MTTLYTATPETMHTDLGDELIVVDGRSGHSFRLNASARLAWLALPTTAQALAARLVAHFDVAPELAEADAAQVLGSLVQSGLARSTDGA